LRHQLTYIEGRAKQLVSKLIQQLRIICDVACFADAAQQLPQILLVLCKLCGGLGLQLGTATAATATAAGADNGMSDQFCGCEQPRVEDTC
jgi:hypothetical protein